MNDTISKYTNGSIAAEIKQSSETALGKLGHSFDEISDKVAETTAELSEKTVSTIKKYPVHSALAAGAVGLIAGAIIARK